jgi:hypothetical protein
MCKISTCSILLVPGQSACFTSPRVGFKTRYTVWRGKRCKHPSLEAHVGPQGYYMNLRLYVPSTQELSCTLNVGGTLQALNLERLSYVDPACQEPRRSNNLKADFYSGLLYSKLHRVVNGLETVAARSKHRYKPGIESEGTSTQGESGR